MRLESEPNGEHLMSDTAPDPVNTPAIRAAWEHLQRCQVRAEKAADELKAAKDSAKHAAKELDRIMADCFGDGENGGLFDDQGGGE